MAEGSEKSANTTDGIAAGSEKPVRVKKWQMKMAGGKHEVIGSRRRKAADVWATGRIKIRESQTVRSDSSCSHTV